MSVSPRYVCTRRTNTIFCCVWSTQPMPSPALPSRAFGHPPPTPELQYCRFAPLTVVPSPTRACHQHICTRTVRHGQTRKTPETKKKKKNSTNAAEKCKTKNHTNKKQRTFARAVHHSREYEETESMKREYRSFDHPFDPHSQVLLNYPPPPSPLNYTHAQQEGDRAEQYSHRGREGRWVMRSG